jgi:ATP-dependent DNA ligase
MIEADSVLSTPPLNAPQSRNRVFDYPQRLRLDQEISVDRRSCAQEPAKAIRHRRRSHDPGCRHKHDNEVQLYAFDIMALDGDDLRDLTLSLRKTNLARLLARRPEGIFVAPFEQGEIGPDPVSGSL